MRILTENFILYISLNKNHKVVTWYITDYSESYSPLYIKKKIIKVKIISFCMKLDSNNSDIF